MKVSKFKKFFKFLFVGFFWTATWGVISQQVILRLFHFNYLSIKQWQMIRSFWQHDGVIKGWADTMLFLCLFLVPVIWILMWRKLMRVNYLRLLIKPFEYFSNRQIEKYRDESKPVVFKNLVVGEKLTLDDLITQKIKQEKKPHDVKAAESLRKKISKKITEQKGK